MKRFSISCSGIGRLALACLLLIAVAGEGVAQGTAQGTAPAAKSGKPAAGKAAAKQPGAEGEAGKARVDVAKLVEDGIKALDAGRNEQAVKAFSDAIGSNEMAPSHMSKALYRRGVAYRRLNKPALAIADLTSALWLKNGLSDAERADALANRSQAYRTAGLPERADADEKRSATATGNVGKGGAGSTTKVVTAPPASGVGSFFGNLFGGNKNAPAAAPATTASVPAKPAEPKPATAPKAADQSTGQAWSTRVSANPAPAQPAATPQAAVKTDAPAAKSGGSSWLSSWFGTSGGAAPAKKQAAEPAPATATAPAAQGSGWSQGTSVITAQGQERR